MKRRIPPAYKLWLLSLWHKYEYFLNSGKLPEDRHLYYDDERWANELGLSTKTIMRARRFWADFEVIRYELGTHRSKATNYWILKKPDKKSPFKPLEEMIFDDKMSAFDDNLSEKDDSLSGKGGQNVTPNNVKNNDINNEINKPANAANSCSDEQELLSEKTVIKEQYLLDSLIKQLGFEVVRDQVERSEIVLEEGVALKNCTS